MSIGASMSDKTHFAITVKQPFCYIELPWRCVMFNTRDAPDGKISLPFDQIPELIAWLMAVHQAFTATEDKP